MKNGDIIVAVEVKTSLSVNDVIANLQRFRYRFPEYHDKKVFGAVGYIHSKGNADMMAQNQGLLVIQGTSKSVVIINPIGFKPKVW